MKCLGSTLLNNNPDPFIGGVQDAAASLRCAR